MIISTSYIVVESGGDLMKQTIKTSRTAGMLEKMYRTLNADLFGGELVTPVITIQSTPRAYGHVTCGKVWKINNDSCTYELNIGAGTLNRPIENIVGTMVHEMVHIYHLMHNIQDTSRGGSYHNKKFKEKAESVGLIIDYDSRIGWSITSVSDDLFQYVCSQDWDDISMYRQEYTPLSVAVGGNSANKGGDDDEAPKVNRPSSTRKYECPNCKLSVRATRDVAIM